MSGRRQVALLLAALGLVAAEPSSAFPPPRHPVIFIHGLTGNANETWGDARDYFIANGWTWGGSPTYDPGTGLVFDTNLGPFPIVLDGPADFYTMNMSDWDAAPFPSQNLTLAEQGLEVAHVVQAVLAVNPNDDHVVLVGQSMGGLAARAYVQELEIIPGVRIPYGNDVAALWTVGTPHQGSPWSAICQQWWLVCQALGFEPLSTAIVTLEVGSSALNAINNLDTFPLDPDSAYISLVNSSHPVLDRGTGDGIVTAVSQDLSRVPSFDPAQSAHHAIEVSIASQAFCDPAWAYGVVDQQSHTCAPHDVDVHRILALLLQPPEVTLMADPPVLDGGGVVTLSWNAPLSLRCTASGAWAGTRPKSGTELRSIQATSTYRLECVGPGGLASATLTVPASALPPPVAHLAVTPGSIAAGGSATLGWASERAESCEASGGWSGPRSTSGSAVVSPSTTTTYTLTCFGEGGSDSSSVTVQVTGSPTALAMSVVPDTILEGDTALLAWASTAGSCTAFGGWSGPQVPTGFRYVSPSSTTTYGLSCSIAGPPTELVRNGAFAGSTHDWIKTGDFQADSRFGNCHSCSGYAYLAEADGSAGNNLFGTLSQQVTLPANATSIDLSLWAGVSTSETTTTTAFDLLSIFVFDASNTFPIAFVAGRSNLDAGPYQEVTYDLTSFAGQTVYIRIIGSTDESLSTVFRVDDVSIRSVVPISVSDDVTVQVTAQPPPPAPTVAFNVSPSFLYSGDPAMLSWSSVGATSCLASGGWTGPRGSSGTETVSPAVTTTYRIDCNGPSGTAAATVQVLVSPQPPSLSLSASPAVIPLGGSSSLSWFTIDATSCAFVDGLTGAVSTAGSTVVSPSSSTNYTLECVGPGGSVSDTIMLVVVPPEPQVWIDAQPMSVAAGNPTTVSWATVNATSCEVFGGWAGDRPTFGSETVTPTSDATFTVTCEGPGGSASATVTVSVARPGILFVDADAVGARTGQTWADAFTDLQEALATAAFGNQIWVAAGSYRPTTQPDRLASFHLVDGVAIYGGFAGTESLLSQRDWRMNRSTLTGDLAGDDGPGFAGYGDNSVNVVVAGGVGGSGVHGGVGPSTVLDGFTIRSGSGGTGAGALIAFGNPVLSNLRFEQNSASANGGGLAILDEAEPTVVGVSFVANASGANGGGLYIRGNPQQLRDLLFHQNVSGCGGGAAVADYASVFVNVRFVENHGTRGGGLCNSGGVVLMNALFNGNSAELDGGAIWQEFYGSLYLYNAVLTQNVAGELGGGIYGDELRGTVRNTVMWRNMDFSGPTEDAQVSTPFGFVAIDHSIVEGWTGQLGGAGNSGDDPLFSNAAGADGIAGNLDDDLHPSEGSPALDAGDNAVPMDSWDLDGDGDLLEPIPRDLEGGARFLDLPLVADAGAGTPPIIDLGPYEMAISDCADGIDNDGDGLTDFGADPGCKDPADSSELVECEDGIDNDGDGFTDYPSDRNCAGSQGDFEAQQPTCGLGGEAILLLLLLPWIRTGTGGRCRSEEHRYQPTTGSARSSG